MVEQGHVTLVQLDPIEEIGANQFDVRLGALEDDGVVDQDLAHIATQIVTNGAHDHVALLVDEHGGGTLLGGLVDGIPVIEQHVQIPGELLGGLADTGGTHDEPHAFRHGKTRQCFFQLGALVTLDAAGDATSTGVVGHQYQVAAGQADKGGEGRTLGATLFLIDLDDHFLALADHFFDVGTTLIGVTGGEIIAGDLL